MKRTLRLFSAALLVPPTCLMACAAAESDPPSRETVATSDAAIGPSNIQVTSDAMVLATALQGTGSAITIQSATYEGAAVAAGTYAQGPLGIPDGILLTSGSAALAAAPSDQSSTSRNNGLAGSPLCDVLMGSGTSYDATKLVLHFDLAEGFDGISLLSIFGSEEYKEFVGSAYNDVYGIYLNGQQVAFDAGGAPITINGPFFQSGEVVVAPATESEYDGSTGLLQTKAPLAGGSQGNILEIVICDGGDRVYDSGVLIAALNGCVGDDCTGTRPCEAVDDDGDGASACIDCDDTSAAVHPGAAESCNGADDNCDGGVDEGATCQPVEPLGSPVTVCTGNNWAPTLAVGAGRFAVGCIQQASQHEVPYVTILDEAGAVITSHPLLTANGYYYTDIQLSYHDGRFQALYDYNCDDNGSWQVGWGWNCLDFREFSTDGAPVGSSLVFGEPGNNTHSMLDWSGSEFGVAWVSYDSVYFRRIAGDRTLVGGGKGDNLLVFETQYDDRDMSRTKLAWDGSGYGVFSILGNSLHFRRVDAAGSVVTPVRVLGEAYSQTFGGQFAVTHRGGAYYVLYRRGDYGDPLPAEIHLMKVGLSGSILNDWTVLTTSADVRYPQMIEKDGRFYVFSQDESNRGVVTVVDETGGIVAPKSGIFHQGPMYAPAPAYDPSTGALAVAYIDATHKGQVKLQRLMDP